MSNTIDLIENRMSDKEWKRICDEIAAYGGKPTTFYAGIDTQKVINKLFGTNLPCVEPILFESGSKANE